MKRFSNSQTITVVEEKVLEKSKNTLYLVLRQKGFAEAADRISGKGKRNEVSLLWK